jgi:hypothetical protein
MTSQEKLAQANAHIKDIRPYVDIDDDGTACLDGRFTAPELRRIAEAIEIAALPVEPDPASPPA